MRYLLLTSIFVAVSSPTLLAAERPDRARAERPMTAELVILRSGSSPFAKGQVTSLRCNQRPSRPEVCRAMRITGETVEKSTPVDPKVAHELLGDGAKSLAPFAGKPKTGAARTLRWRVTWEGKTLEGTMDESAQKPLLEAIAKAEKGLVRELERSRK